LSTLDAVEDRRAGLVVAPFGLNALAEMRADQVPGFYLLVPRSRRRVKSVAAFCDWVASEDWAKAGTADDVGQGGSTFGAA